MYLTLRKFLTGFFNVTEIFSNIATAFGLSSSAGLNAYLPLLVVSFTAKYTSLIELNQPWDVLTNWWVIGVLIVLLLVEMSCCYWRLR